MTDTETRIAIFKQKSIRKTIYQNEWWFSVVDVIAALTDSENPRDYWYKMKIRVKSEDHLELSTLCRQLKLPSSDGKSYLTDCANTENVFRISLPPELQTVDRISIMINEAANRLDPAPDTLQLVDSQGEPVEYPEEAADAIGSYRVRAGK